MIYVAGDVLDKDFFCGTCVHGKMHRLPRYHKKEHKEDQRYDVGECFCTDLWGPMLVSLGGSNYFMLVKDWISMYLFVYFLKDKTETVTYSKNLYQHIKVSVNKSVKMVRTNNGLEFIWNYISLYFVISPSNSFFLTMMRYWVTLTLTASSKMAGFKMKIEQWLNRLEAVYIKIPSQNTCGQKPLTSSGTLSSYEDTS